MGLDLTLLPIDHLEWVQNSATVRASGYSHTVLPVRRDSKLFKAITDQEPVEIPDGYNIDSYLASDLTYGPISVDKYGDRLTWIRAGKIKTPLIASQPDAPVTCYVCALDDEALVILFWR